MPERPRDRAACIAVVVAATLALVIVAARAKQWTHPDCAMYLYLGDMILDGKVPYVDFVEVNPPMVMYLSVIPAGIARLTGAGAISVLNALVVVLAGGGALLVQRYLRFALPELRPAHRCLAALLWLLFTFYVMVGGVADLPSSAVGSDAGQREHFLVLGFVPFMLLRWARWESRSLPIGRIEAALVGVLAGIMVCLKPYFAAVPLAVELHGLLLRRRPRLLLAPEMFGLVGAGVGYLLHFALVPAAMRAAFFGRWLPLAAERYAAYHSTWDHVFSQRSLHVVIAMLVLMMAPWRRRYRVMVRRIYPVASFSVGGAVAMIAQHKGWLYHLVPLHAGVWLAITLLFVQLLEDHERRAPSPGEGAPGDGAPGPAGTPRTPGDGLARLSRAILRFRPLAFGVLFCAWPVSVIAHSPQMFEPFRSDTLEYVRAHAAPGDSVLYLSTSVAPGFPEMLHARAAPGSRYVWGFPFAYLVAGESRGADFPAEREDEARALIAEVSEDIQARRPRVVFLWSGVNAASPRDFLLARFLEDRGFMEDGLRGYQFTTRIGLWAVFTPSADANATPVAPAIPAPRGPRFRSLR